MRKLEDLVFIVIGCLVVFGIFLVIYGKVFGLVSSYSEGERVGVITKFSKKGLIFKSWEGELLQGGMKQGRDSVANVVGFNASDEAVIQSIKLASESGKPVKLIYSQWLIQPIYIDHSRVITGVEILD